MLFRDLLNKTKAMAELVAVSIGAAGTTNGLTVDRQGFGAVEFLVNFAALAGTYDGSNYLTIFIEDSPDNSTFTPITDQTILGNGSGNPMTDITTGKWIIMNSGTVRDALKSKCTRLDYRGAKRYVRLRFVATGGSFAATILSSEAILFDPAQAGDTNMLPSISTGNDVG